MSNQIDEKVVEMRFDNKDFENNVQTSLTTLDKLKNSLNLSDSAKGLENIGNAAKNLSFGGLASGIETIGSRFSALEVVAITALQNITNSALNAGKQMLRSLTTEPVSDGFKEYELKMDSVQTIMAGTGADLDTVMDKLNELNTYADKTIYSFSDMTNNIGKFTNAGVKLDDAVAAIQGVANVAAVSGANSNEASRAMYNFAQALSAGYVKLIDWKSIENANMATVEFKTQLLESAVAAGKLEKTSDGMYKVLTTNAQGSTMSDTISATKNFNDSLAYQWMTTDVLTKTLGDYADETTKIGKKAYAAAQDVKTFSQLIDTLKEAVGSGWAETWETIFGNFDEAKQLWTGVSNVVGGFIDQQSKARNLTLQNWKLLGGRTDLIDSIKNIFDGLSPIAKNVSDAFREVFKPITGIQLADATKALKDLTERFQLSGYTLQKIKNTFKGFFSLLDIGKQGISAVVDGLSPLLGKLPDLGGRILDVTSEFGQWAIALDETLKKNETFKKGVENLTSFLKDAASKFDSVFKDITGYTVGEAFDKILEKLSDTRKKFQNFFDSFTSIDTSGIGSLAEKVESPFAPIFSLFNGLKKVLSGVFMFLKDSVLPVFSGLITEIGNRLGILGNQISDAAGNADLSKLLDIVNGGILVSIGIGIKKFVDSLTGASNDGFLSNLKDTMGSIKDVFDGVCDSLKVWQQDLKAGTLLKIAGAVAILTGSILLLSGIEPEKIGAALGAMTTEFIELLGAMAFIDKFLGDSKAKDLSKLSTTMLKISAAMLIFSFAIEKLSSVEPDKLANGLEAIGGALLEVIMFLAIAKAGKIENSVSGLIGLGIALNLVAIAIEKFSSIDAAKLANGLFAMGAALLEITMFLAITKAGDITSTASGLIGLGIAMNIFAKAIEALGEIDIGKLMNGLFAMGAALLEITLFLAITKAGDITSTASGLIGLGIALNIVTLAIEKLGAIDEQKLANGLFAMGIALVEILTAANAMKGTLSGAAALLVVAGALAVLCPVLKVLGSMPMPEIGKSLLILAGAFTVIGVAGLLLTPIVPGILALAGSIALLGVGALACGAAVGILAAGLTALAVGGVAGITALMMVIKSVIQLIPSIIQSIGTGLLLVIATIGEAAPTIMGTVTSILVAISQAIINASPQIVAAAVTLIGSLLNGIVQLVPAVVEAAGQIIVGFLTGLSTQLPAVIQAGFELVVAFINGVAEALRGNAGPLFEALGNLLSSIIEMVLTGLQTIVQAIPVIGDNLSSGLDTVKQNIRETLAPEDMKDAASDAVSGIASGISSSESDVKKATSGIGDLVSDGLKGNSGEWTGGGGKIVKEFAGGMTSSSGTASSAATSIGDAVQNGLESVDSSGAASDILSQYTSTFSGGGGEIESSVNSLVSSATGAFGSADSGFKSSGKSNIDAYASGVKAEQNKAGSSAKTVASRSAKSADSQKSSFTSAGKNGGAGFVAGLKSYYHVSYSAGYNLGKEAKKGAEDALDINSPSKEFGKLGAYSGQGYVNALLSYASRAGDAAANVGKSAIDSARNVVRHLADSISGNLDTEPTIRPVLDLSDIQAGAGAVSRMLSGRYAFGVRGNLDAISTMMQENQNGASNDDVVSAINKLRKDISGIGNTTYNVNGVTYDDGSNITEAVRTLVRAARIERRT